MKFTYGNLLSTQETFAPEDDRSAFTVSRNPHFFNLNPKKQVDTDSYGWKLRVSAIPEDIGPAWDVLLPLLEEYGVPAKVVTPAAAKEIWDWHHPQKGKTITIYFDKQPDEYWQLFCLKAEQLLRSVPIRCGLATSSDIALKGSGYLS